MFKFKKKWSWNLIKIIYRDFRRNIYQDISILFQPIPGPPIQWSFNIGLKKFRGVTKSSLTFYQPLMTLGWQNFKKNRKSLALGDTIACFFYFFNFERIKQKLNLLTKILSKSLKQVRTPIFFKACIELPLRIDWSASVNSKQPIKPATLEENWNKKLVLGKSLQKS